MYLPIAKADLTSDWDGVWMFWQCGGRSEDRQLGVEIVA
jgi:hypothetical protein